MTVTRLPLETWPQDLIERLARRSLFTSPDFLRLWNTLDGRICGWQIDHDGDRLFLPGVEFGYGPFKRFQAGPDGLMGTTEPEDASLDRITTRQLLERLTRAGYMRVHLTDWSQQFPADPRWQIEERTAHVVTIDGAEWEPPDAKLRSEIRKAEREGIRARSFETERHLKQFMKLVTVSERRHGRDPRYPDSFYVALAELAKHDHRVLWYVVEHDEALAASHIFLRDHDRLLHWQVYFDKEYSWLKPVGALG